MCAACHGADGNSTDPRAPSLAGQPAFYIHWQLIFFRDKRRVDPEMSSFAASLTDEQMGDLAAYYAAQTTLPPPPAPRDPEKIAAGRQRSAITADPAKRRGSRASSTCRASPDCRTTISCDSSAASRRNSGPSWTVT